MDEQPSIEYNQNNLEDNQQQRKAGSQASVENIQNVGAASPNESIQDRVPCSEQMVEELEEDDVYNQIRLLIEKTEKLHADQQFLKEELKVREEETLATYSNLVQKKKVLLKLVSESFNRQSAFIDIGLTEEFDELRKIIQGQQNKIAQLKSEISRQGLAGVLNDESFIKIKNKTEQIEKEIKVGRKFSSTQYVRDYLQRPQAYKVNYQQAKYEYQLRLRLKQTLQLEKILYERRKQEISQAKKRERELQQQLHKQLDSLQR